MLRKVRKIIMHIRPLFVYFLGAKRDKYILNILKEQVASEYLNRKYVDKYFKKKGISTYIEGKTSHICWIYWRQGIICAPDIVKICVSSTAELFKKNEWKVKILDLKTAKEKCMFPNYIWEKYYKGLISDAHLSDLIRLKLLKEYGGVWVDATVLFTEKEVIPSYFYSQDLFVYRNYMNKDNYINISNWIMGSCPNNTIITAVLDILLDYWKEEGITVQYYIFHLVYKLVTEKYLDYWNSLPIVSNIPPHILQGELLNNYKKCNWDIILQNSCVHKLYWKLPKEIGNNTYYKKIINKYSEQMLAFFYEYEKNQDYYN